MPAPANAEYSPRYCTSRFAGRKLRPMNIHELIRELREPTTAKIVLLVADGLGGLPLEPGGKTELETARTPNLDACARDGVCGLSIPVLPGITPGSGPGPPRAVRLRPAANTGSAGASSRPSGINFSVGPKDVAIRGQLLHARRTARSPTAAPAGRRNEQCKAMCREDCGTIKIPGVELFVEPVKEHRFVLVFRGDGLGDHVNDTDPQAVGVAPLKAEGRRRRVEEDGASRQRVRRPGGEGARRTRPRPTAARSAGSPATRRSPRCRTSTA